MNSPQQFSLEVTTDLCALDQVLSWFNQTYFAAIPQKDWLQCQLALAEGFTNAVRHAHRNLPPETPIALQVSFSADLMEIRIWDSGPPFDFEQKIQNLRQEPDYKSGGGRGIVLMSKIADRLSYTRTEDNRNCLLMVKQYPSQEG